MAGYTELVKRLRDCTADLRKIAHAYKGRITPYMRLTICKAADAIEELSKLADAIPHVCECCVGCELETMNGGCDHAFVLSPQRAMQYLIKPRWIPVAERLPGAWQPVYAAVRSDGREDWVIEGVYDPYLSCPWGHIPMLESGKATVYAWMPRPLPEPPKEET